MILRPRPYQNDSDLQKMCSLLSAGCSRLTNTYYPHPGDLKWWLFYWLAPHEPHSFVYLWDDPAAPERLLGWCLVSTPWGGFEVYVQPELWNSPWAFEANLWAEEMTAETNRAQQLDGIWRMNIAETDLILREHLKERGFQRVQGEEQWSLARSLEDTLPPPDVPAGFSVRQAAREDLDTRACAQHAAFQSCVPFPEYLERYRHFMTSPGYPHGCDWVTIAPDGRAASFCIAWSDPLTGIGQLEPVGTHPDFQRLGLGKAVMYAGLKQLQVAGIHTVRICARADNPAALRLYTRVGFHVVRMLLTYKKKID